jgi:hypothetical protein
MKYFSFQLNLILTSVALISAIIANSIGFTLNSSIGLLVILGLYQVFISFILTFYAIIYNRLLLILYILYWFIVTLFFKFFLGQFFYMCLIIALYNLYINYCSFSNSKYNITK